VNPGWSHKVRCLLTLLLVVLPAGVVMGQATKPSADADEALASQPLRITDNDLKAATVRSTTSSAFTSGTSDLSRIAIALLVVISLILLLRAGFRQITNGAVGGKGSKLVTVLSRSILSPKQQVLVLQVGKRLLVVGDSGGHMSSLCEISDPDEIASMVGQTRQSSLPPRAAFGSLFKRANEPFTETDALQMPTDESDAHERDDEEPASDIQPNDAVSAEEVGGLLDKVRMLQQQFNDAKQPHVERSLS
jgi:flagellar biogenesis protein FliO